MFKFVQGVFHNFKTKHQTSFSNCCKLLSTTSSLNMLSQNFKILNLNSNLLSKTTNNSILPKIEQIRHGSFGYKGRMMLKDIKRRELLRKFAPERVRLQTLRANWILPKFFRRIVAENLQKLTKHSSLFFIRNRCGFTSKAGGTMDRWRLSRHLWRDIADYNHMSGVMTAKWGTPTRNAVHFTYKGARRTWFNYDGIKNISFMNKKGEVKRFPIKMT